MSQNVFGTKLISPFGSYLKVDENISEDINTTIENIFKKYSEFNLRDIKEIILNEVDWTYHWQMTKQEAVIGSELKKLGYSTEEISRILLGEQPAPTEVRTMTWKEIEEKWNNFGEEYE